MYMIIDRFGDFPTLVTNEYGIPLEFETKEQAIEYAEKELQKGYWKVIT